MTERPAKPARNLQSEPSSVLRLFSLEVQTKLSLERTGAGFVPNEVSEVLAVDVERGIRWIRMIQDIRRIKPDLYGFGFRDLECLAEIRVKPDCPRAFYCGLTDRSLLSRDRIHKEVLNRRAIRQRRGSCCSRIDQSRNRTKSAVHSRRSPALRDGALRIFNR